MRAPNDPHARRRLGIIKRLRLQPASAAVRVQSQLVGPPSLVNNRARRRARTDTVLVRRVENAEYSRWPCAGCSHLLALANPAVSCQRQSPSNAACFGVNCDGSSAGQSIGFLIRSVRISPSYPESSGVISHRILSRLQPIRLILSYPENSEISKSGDNSA